MPWVALLHIAFMSAWFGSLVALPRLFAEHARAEHADDRLWYLSMERKLFQIAMTPAAVLTVLSGFWLLFSYGFEGGWLPVKLAGVSLLALTHLHQGKVLADFRDGSNTRRNWLFNLQSLIPLTLASAIIVLVVGKPF